MMTDYQKGPGNIPMSECIDYTELSEDERRRCIVPGDPMGDYHGLPEAQKQILAYEREERAMRVVEAIISSELLKITTEDSARA